MNQVRNQLRLSTQTVSRAEAVIKEQRRARHVPTGERKPITLKQLQRYPAAQAAVARSLAQGNLTRIEKDHQSLIIHNHPDWYLR